MLSGLIIPREMGASGLIVGRLFFECVGWIRQVVGNVAGHGKGGGRIQARVTGTTTRRKPTSPGLK